MNHRLGSASLAKHWWVPVTLVFVSIYATALTFEYVEGDDAQSMAFHLLGADKTFQPPFAYYETGADLVMGLVPVAEPALRFAGIAGSAVFAILATVAMLAVVFHWMGDVEPAVKWTVAVLLPFAMPELLFLGLVYHPDLVAMAGLLASHALLRDTLVRPPEQRWRLAAQMLLSAILLGVGTSFRWNNVLYVLIVLVDLWTLLGGRRAVAVWLGWGVLGGLAWAGVLAAAGYGAVEVNWVLMQAQTTALRNRDLVLTTIYALSVFTPGLLAFAALGARSWRRSAAGALSVGVYAYLMHWLNWEAPKEGLFLLPPVVWLFAEGVRAAAATPRRFAACGALVAVPWIVGVAATEPGKGWGPGFELRRFDDEQPRSLALMWAEGAAVPSLEGPRPLFGYAGVFGGSWRRLTNDLADARARGIVAALKRDLPIIALERTSGYMVAGLARVGLTTRDRLELPNESSSIDDEYWWVRRFEGGEGSNRLHATLVCWTPKLQRLVTDPRATQAVIDRLGVDRAFVFGYPATLRKMYRVADDAMEVVGPEEAIVDLARYVARLDAARVTTEERVQRSDESRR